jgi:hypothetical protein
MLAQKKLTMQGDVNSLKKRKSQMRIWLKLLILGHIYHLSDKAKTWCLFRHNEPLVIGVSQHNFRTTFFCNCFLQKSSAIRNSAEGEGEEMTMRNGVVGWNCGPGSVGIDKHFNK